MKKPAKRGSRRWKRWNRLRRMFQQQKGLCYYCGNEMVMPEKGSKHRTPKHATLEHLYDRYERPRNNTSVRDTVAACWKCNNQMNTQRQRELPVEVLQEKSGSKPGGCVPDNMALMGEEEFDEDRQD